MRVFARRANAVCHAPHVGFAGPVKLGKGALGVQCVAALQFWHEVPVEAADILAPTNDLADEAFNRIERRIVFFIGLLRTLAQFQRVEQAQVDARRQHGVVEIVRPVHHRVLIRAEFLDPFCEEGIGGFLCLRARNGPFEVLQRSKVIAKLAFDQFDHFACNFVRFEFRPCGRVHADFGRLAVFLVEIPFTADRLAVAAHEKTGFLAHFAIEIFHRQMLATLGPFLEFGMRAKETVIGQNLDVTDELVWPFVLHLAHAPLACFHHMD